MNMSNYLKAVLKELKLTTFPTQTTVVNFTIFVILFTAAVAVYLGVLDLGFGKGTISFIETMKSEYGLQQVQPVLEVATSTATVTDILLK